MEKEANEQMLDAMSLGNVRLLLKANGFTFVTRKELQVVRAVKQTKLSSSTGVHPGETTDTRGSQQVEYFTELAGQRVQREG